MSDGVNVDRDGRPAGERDHDKRVATRLIVAAVALVVAVIVIAQNTDEVHVEFLFFDGQMRLWVFALLMLLVGAGLGQLAGILVRRRRQRSE